MRHGMWPRPNNTHTPLQYVYKLRQFIERTAPQERAHLSHPLVALGRLEHFHAVFRHRHRTEFIDDDLLAVEAVASLPEDDRAGRADLDGDGNQQHYRQQRDLDAQSQHDIAGTLDHAVKASKRRFADGDDRHAADVIKARLHQVKDVNIRQEINRSRRILQLVQQFADARLRRNWLADENHFDVMITHIIGDIGHFAQHRMTHFRRPAVLGTVVEKTTNLHE